VRPRGLGGDTGGILRRLSCVGHFLSRPDRTTISSLSFIELAANVSITLCGVICAQGVGRRDSLAIVIMHSCHTPSKKSSTRCKERGPTPADRPFSADLPDVIFGRDWRRTERPPFATSAIRTL